MLTPEYIKSEADKAQAKFRSLAVASGMVTQEEADQFIVVLPGDPADPIFASHTECCEGCGCKPQDMVPLQIGLAESLGDLRFKLLDLLQNSGGAEN